ncbi:uncharacterized protein LOC131160050 [Malania oleifera]|uniref:uncharacterized protein LOC131160050 n=1 Tax=Malania oleifera TaxID=397392 RepID=UPI0025ADE608|nr:uncharacterized protein LOC131160050 [Malania oleifera]
MTLFSSSSSSFPSDTTIRRSSNGYRYRFAPRIQIRRNHRELWTFLLVNSSVLPANDICSPDITSRGELHPLFGHINEKSIAIAAKILTYPYKFRVWHPNNGFVLCLWNPKVTVSLLSSALMVMISSLLVHRRSISALLSSRIGIVPPASSSRLLIRIKIFLCLI